VTTLTIDEHDAQRLFAQILRDELKLQPAQANALADTFRRRVLATMPVAEQSVALSEWRAIQKYPGHMPEFVGELRRYVPQADQESAHDIWRAVYKFCRDLPVDLMAKLTSDERAQRNAGTSAGT
jgi:hypothetical protein